MKDKIEKSDFEKQSGLDRVRHAELLILQMPEDHEGRNTWLINYGTSETALALRLEHDLEFDHATMSAKTRRIGSIEMMKCV